MPKSIFACLIGIGEYPTEKHRLVGPARDLQLMQELIKTAADRSKRAFHKKVLVHQNATRHEVISSFDFFHEAGKDDVCLLYYSGHGSRNHAPYFVNQPDQMVETIVCHDSRSKNGLDMADKEIAFLLKSVAQFRAHPPGFDCARLWRDFALHHSWCCWPSS